MSNANHEVRGRPTVQIPACRAEFDSRFTRRLIAPPAPLVNSAMMSTGSSPLNAEVKKMMPLTLHTLGIHRASLKD